MSTHILVSTRSIFTILGGLAAGVWLSACGPDSLAGALPDSGSTIPMNRSDGGDDAGLPPPDASTDAGLPETDAGMNPDAGTTSKPDAGVWAFPSAEGWGAETRGGRGGKVLHVTNLKDDGVGSLRWAMTQKFPRMVVFDVSGTIVLNSGISLRAGQGRLTVAGQTSPGGIQLKGAQDLTRPFEGIVVASGADDVVIRFLRIRSGRPNPPHVDGGLGVWGDNGRVSRVIFDHNSLEWATHSAIWNWGDTSHVTVSWNLVAMANHAGLDAGRNGSSHHNLVVHAFYGLTSRGWKVETAESEFRNNIIFNTWYALGRWGDYGYNRTTFANIVNNWFIAGSLTKGTSYLWFQNGGPTRPDGTAATFGGSKFYLEGNWGPRCLTGCKDDWAHVPGTADGNAVEYPTTAATATQFRASKPFALAGSKVPVTTYPTSQLESVIPPKVGAYKPTRDVMDALYIEDFMKRRAMDSKTLQGNGGPWPDLATGAPSAPLDSDQDGMPDAWETAHGLDPHKEADGAMVAKNGYTNVENYLNALAGDSVP